MTKIAGSESVSISQSHVSADPDPDPPQNVMDPQHWFPSTHTITWKNVRESFKNIAIVEITPSFSFVGSAQ
jgi:hypothetical protein